MRPSLPIVEERPERKPDWLKIRPPGGPEWAALKKSARKLALATVCEEAQCPNLSDCWGGGTATFMLMGDTCTRGCRFCAINTARMPPPLDPDEPQHIAEAVEAMGLTYVVLTSVNRDELSDGGAAHLARCLETIHARTPKVLIEILVPDFEGNVDAVQTILEAPIAVFAHNVECVERLTERVRDPRASYQQSLDVLDYAKKNAPHLLTKSSVMLGLGETEAELVRALEDLRESGVDIVTLGQYLRPSSKHLPVEAYVTPADFDRFGRIAEDLGFGYVASGPLVRSSYRAGELFIEKTLRGQ